MATKKPPKKIPQQAAPASTDAAEEAAAGFPIVGIGASAGGLAAIEAFFSGMPADPGMAFVLVQHLIPGHQSVLADIIRRRTRMQVFEAEDGMAVQPNRIYLIPPDRDMAYFNGALQLLDPAHDPHLPIDFFFRSLAHDLGQRAIGIVLSGAGNDGTLGVRAIKGEGGMVMAQNPKSAEYDSMPRSAIATVQVDYELPPAEMPAHLIAYVAYAFGQLHKPVAGLLAETESALKKIFILLRAQTGHDFSGYKPSTVNRRIERRMAVRQIEALDGYVRYLQQTPAEVDALFRDLLIGVTNFFRDPEAFRVLEEQVIPKLFDDKPAGSVIRVWAPGCSTGEEAYSIAILLQEHIESLKQSYTVQVFATDIDSRAIATARLGLYPTSIVADISAERLARFFTAEPNGVAYRVNKSIRELLVFSEQDVIKDPPFSRLDMICCRNLLIYMGTALQKKLIPLFHYALKPGGMLFLGGSEGVGEFADLFAVLDRRSKLFRRKEDTHGARRSVPSRFLPPLIEMEGELSGSAARTAFPLKQSLRELAEQAILQQVTPACALVNGKGDILYLHGRSGMYLEPAQGEAGINNILKMAREGLRRNLSIALHKAASIKEIVRCPGLLVKTNGHFTTVNLTIRPVTTGAAATFDPPLYLVMLEDAPPAAGQTQASAAPASAETSSADSDERIAALMQELRAKDEYLRSTHEELETSNEELKSSNEEMQSVNEEMQSVNEELVTLNTELQINVTDLSQANNDMNNLLAGTGIATVFLDRLLRIMRFTPFASRIINLILSDVGRPLDHVSTNLVGYDRLVADTQVVLDTLVAKEVDVQTRMGDWYLLRILPYRTLNDVIEGVVLTFVDITETMKAQESLRKSEARLRESLDSLLEGCRIIGFDWRYLYLNESAARHNRQAREKFLGRTMMEVFPGIEDTKMFAVLKQVMTERNAQQMVNQFAFEDGSTGWFELHIQPVDEGICIFSVDISERRSAEVALRKNHEAFLGILETTLDGYWCVDAQGNLLDVNNTYCMQSGYTHEELLGMRIPDLNIKVDAAYIAEQGERIIEKGHDQFETVHRRKDGSLWHVEVSVTYRDVEGGQFYVFLRDISERMRLDTALRESEARFRTLCEDAPEAIVIHDLDSGLFVDATSSAERLFACSHEEIVRHSPQYFYAPEQPEGAPSCDSIRERGQRILAGEQMKFERLVRNRKGQDILCEVRLVRLPSPNRKLIRASYIDISERKRVEAALLAAKSEAERANQAKSRFLAAASHDLRQPLSALALYFEVLKNRIPPGSEELVIDIQDCVGSLTGLLTDLLDVSKLEAGVVTVKPADIAIDDLIAALVPLHSAEARVKGLHLRARCSGMVVHTDPQLLRRILGNLLANAIHFTGKGGVLIACRRHQGRRWIEIWDTGIGIPADQTEVIFEEFRQLGDEARNRGSGLGLAIVARTAKLLGLAIRVRSRAGRGSMFAVELPVERTNAADIEPSPPATLPQTRSLRIGLVEDHPDVLRALALVLKSLGHEVIAATCGSSLIEKLGALVPDMVISDYRLAEGETGFGVITAARNIFGDELPAFLITGDTDPAVVRGMAERGIEVLFKPLQVAAMQVAIGKATTRRRGA